MPAPQILPLASATAPSAVHGVAWLPVPSIAGAHLAAVGGTPLGSGWAQLYTLSGTTNLRLEASTPPSTAPSTLRCCCIVGGGGGGSIHSIIAGGTDGTLRAWALDGRGGLVETTTASAPHHSGSVHDLTTPADGSNAPSTPFASAGSDGAVAVWDCRAGLADKPVMRLGGDSDARTSAGPAWAVALTGSVATQSTPDHLLLAGHATGLLRAWCLRTGRVRWAGRLPGGPGVCGVGLGPHATHAGEPGTYLAAATGGLVVALEAVTCHPACGLAATAARLGSGDGRGPPPTAWTALPLPGSRGLVGCACGDGRLRLLRHRRAAGSARTTAADGRASGVPGSLTSLACAKLGDQALTCLAWCGGHAGLFATGGMDEAVRVGVVPKAGSV